MFEPRENSGGDTLTGFENDITDETIADYNFDRALEKIPSLDISYEVDGSGGEEFEAFLRQGVALHIF